MDEKGFRAFLREGKQVPKGLDKKTIEMNIRMVREFEKFLRRKNPKRQFADAKERDIRAFIRHLAKEDRNTLDNLIGLMRYARFSGNKDAALSLLIILDGSTILGLLSDAVKEKHGKRMQDELLGDFRQPSIGTSFKLLPRKTRDFMDRLEAGIGEKATREVLLTGPHAAPPEAYAEEKEWLKESKDIDEYLLKRREKFVDELREHMENDTLFFTQPINQDALDYVKRNPEIGGGVRKGKKIYQMKVPYMMIEYLKEKDPTMKRYYYCHCPLARESILSGEKISRNFCYCSAGFEKKPFEVAFGRPLKADVEKSVLWGDAVCRFAVEIPEEYLRGKT